MPNFSRIMTICVPVSPTSANTPFQMPAELIGVSDLVFEFINPNPFDIALEGTPGTAPFIPASWPSRSWLVKAREHTSSYISKQPTRLSAVAVATSGCPLPDDGFDYSNCYLSLVYGQARGKQR